MSLKGGTFNGIVKMMYCSYTHFVNFPILYGTETKVSEQCVK
jgi:hypothetical protein